MDEFNENLRFLIKRWAQVDYLIDHYGFDEDEYFSALVWEKAELEQKIAELLSAECAPKRIQSEVGGQICEPPTPIPS